MRHRDFRCWNRVLPPRRRSIRQNHLCAGGLHADLFRGLINTQGDRIRRYLGARILFVDKVAHDIDLIATDLGDPAGMGFLPGLAGAQGRRGDRSADFGRFVAGTLAQALGRAGAGRRRLFRLRPSALAGVGISSEPIVRGTNRDA